MTILFNNNFPTDANRPIFLLRPENTQRKLFLVLKSALLLFLFENVEDSYVRLGTIPTLSHLAFNHNCEREMKEIIKMEHLQDLVNHQPNISIAVPSILKTVHGVVLHAEPVRNVRVGSFRRFPEKPTNRYLQPICFSRRFQAIKINGQFFNQCIYLTISYAYAIFYP